MPSGFLGRGIGPQALGGGGLVDPVPVAGTELVANGDFASATGWTTGTPMWSIGGGVGIASGGAENNLYQTGKAAIAQWHIMEWDLVTCTAGSMQGRVGLSYFGTSFTTGASTPGHCLFTALAINVSSGTVGFVGKVNFAGTVDNASVKTLSLSSLLSTRVYASPNCDISAAVTRTTGTQAGIAARLDSAGSPANFLIAYLDGTGNVKVDKCIAGVYTNVISGAVTYAAGRVLRLVCSGSNVSAYYNGTQVGTTQTVSDAGIVGNTCHGKFSTYASNVLANYTIV